MVDIGIRPNDKGSERIINFMRSGINGFSSVEEAADAVSAYLPNRKRPKDVSGLEKNLRLGEDKRYYWHWDPLFLADKGGNIKERKKRREIQTTRIRCSKCYCSIFISAGSIERYFD